jgi:hypothetical protein
MNIDTFLEYIPSNDYDYQRMQNRSECYENMRYEEFRELNIKKFESLSETEKEFLAKLIEQINRNKLKMCDMESCVEFLVVGFYYNKKEQLVLYCPR